LHLHHGLDIEDLLRPHWIGQYYYYYYYYYYYLSQNDRMLRGNPQRREAFTGMSM